MKFYYLITMLVFFSFACSDENGIIEQGNEDNTCGNDVVFVATLSSSENSTKTFLNLDDAFFRDKETWDNGFVNDSIDEEPVSYYPLDEIYL